jgi:hypothetical protein
MMKKAGTEAVDLHLEAYAFMSGHLIAVALKADAALELAMDALQRYVHTYARTHGATHAHNTHLNLVIRRVCYTCVVVVVFPAIGGTRAMLFTLIS